MNQAERTEDGVLPPVTGTKRGGVTRAGGRTEGGPLPPVTGTGRDGAVTNGAQADRSALMREAGPKGHPISDGIGSQDHATEHGLGSEDAHLRTHGVGPEGRGLAQNTGGSAPDGIDAAADRLGGPKANTVSSFVPSLSHCSHPHDHIFCIFVASWLP